MWGEHVRAALLFRGSSGCTKLLALQYVLRISCVRTNLAVRRRSTNVQLHVSRYRHAITSMTSLHTAQYSFLYTCPVFVSETGGRLLAPSVQFPSTNVSSRLSPQLSGQADTIQNASFSPGATLLFRYVLWHSNNGAATLLAVVVSHHGQQSPKSSHSASQRQSWLSNIAH